MNVVVAVGDTSRRSVFEDHTATDGDDRRKLTHDEAVSWQEQYGFWKAKLGEAGLSRANLETRRKFGARGLRIRRWLRSVMKHDFGHGLHGVGMKVNARAILERLG